jgi:hypothetical protein
MNFADESYVRLYVRDTKTWLQLGFAGQCVLMFLLRKVDRAGVLDGIEDLCPDVALITGVPNHIVEIGLPRLLGRGVFELHGQCLVMPNFIAAQTAVRTDKARQKDARDKRLAESRLVTLRDSIVTPRDAGVTPRDETVTRIETAQQPVTLYCTDPNQTKPSLTELKTDTSPPAPASPPVRVVFDHWRAKLNHSRAVLNAKRERVIRARLKEFSPEDLCKAIDGCARSDFHMGRSPRSEGRVFDDIELICRDASKVENFIRIADGKATTLAEIAGPPRRGRNSDALDYALQMAQGETQ